MQEHIPAIHRIERHPADVLMTYFITSMRVVELYPFKPSFHIYREVAKRAFLKDLEEIGKQYETDDGVWLDIDRIKEECGL